MKKINCSPGAIEKMASYRPKELFAFLVSALSEMVGQPLEKRYRIDVGFAIFGGQKPLIKGLSISDQMKVYKKYLEFNMQVHECSLLEKQIDLWLDGPDGFEKTVELLDESAASQIRKIDFSKYGKNSVEKTKALMQIESLCTLYGKQAAIALAEKCAEDRSILDCIFEIVAPFSQKGHEKILFNIAIHARINSFEHKFQSLCDKILSANPTFAPKVRAYKVARPQAEVKKDETKNEVAPMKPAFVPLGPGVEKTEVEKLKSPNVLRKVDLGRKTFSKNPMVVEAEEKRAKNSQVAKVENRLAAKKQATTVPSSAPAKVGSKTTPKNNVVKNKQQIMEDVHLSKKRIAEIKEMSPDELYATLMQYLMRTKCTEKNQKFRHSLGYLIFTSEEANIEPLITKLDIPQREKIISEYKRFNPKRHNLISDAMLFHKCRAEEVLEDESNTLANTPAGAVLLKMKFNDQTHAQVKQANA